MNKSFAIIVRGLGVASLGFVATSLLILSLSSVFLGKWSQAIMLLLAAAFGFFLFYRWLDPFLSELEKRFDQNSL